MPQEKRQIHGGDQVASLGGGAKPFAALLCWLLVGLAAFLGPAGCGGTNASRKISPPPSSSAPPMRILLGPGDVLSVKFLNLPSLNQSQAIRPDGVISLQLVGEVRAAGLTPAQLKSKLLLLYARELRDPQLALIIDKLGSRRVYVGGQVVRPGLILMSGPMTALEAVLAAGGFRYQTAKRSSVVVVRQEGGNRLVRKLDMDDALEGKGQPFYLQPKDIVFVPRTIIARVNQWVDQHLNRLIPRLGVVYSRPIGDGNVTVDSTTQPGAQY